MMTIFHEWHRYGTYDGGLLCLVNYHMTHIRHTLTILLIVSLPCFLAQHRVQEVGIGIILPLHDISFARESCWSLDRLLGNIQSLDYPSITRSILHARTLSIRPRVKDSRCSDIYGPIAAMDMVYRQSKKPHVFLGPCCKDALGPVARYSKRWDVPVLTPGGLTAKFSNKTRYPMVTRVMPPYNKLTAFLRTVVQLYKFQQTALVWHDYLATRTTYRSECSDMMETLYSDREPLTDLEPYRFEFDEDDLDHMDITNMLLDVSNHSRGKTAMILGNRSLRASSIELEELIIIL